MVLFDFSWVSSLFRRMTERDKEEREILEAFDGGQLKRSRKVTE